MRVRRRLAAIAFADVVGFSRRVSRNETEGLSRRREVEELIRATVAEHGGRLVKSLGDGVMLEFASAVVALEASLDIQSRLAALNCDLDAAEQVRVRIGLHVGDVVEEEGDLHGNAVNIASRLEKVARPGGICITRDVYSQVRAALPVLCTPVPPERLTNLPEPVQVFHVEAADHEPASAELTGNVDTGALAPISGSPSDLGWLSLTAGIVSLLAAGGSAALGIALFRGTNPFFGVASWLFAADAAKAGVRQVQEAFWSRPQANASPTADDNAARGWRRLTAGGVLLLTGLVAAGLIGLIPKENLAPAIMTLLFAGATAKQGLALVQGAPTGQIVEDEDEEEEQEEEAPRLGDSFRLSDVQKLGQETHLAPRTAAIFSLVALALAAALGFAGTLPEWNHGFQSILKLGLWGGAGLCGLTAVWGLYDSWKSVGKLAPLDAEIVEACHKLGTVPEPISEALDRALGAYGRIRSMLNEPVWKSAKVPAAQNLKDARRQLLAILERAEQLQIVRRTLQQLEGRRAASEEYQRIDFQYHRQCRRLTAAADLFEDLEARIARAYLALTTHRTSDLQTSAESLQQIHVAFEALTEVLESLDDETPTPALPAAPVEEAQVLRAGR